jgi:polar amino acid transport system permease protein
MHKLQFAPVFHDFGLLLHGAALTLWLTLISSVIGLAIAAVFAYLRGSHNAAVRGAITFYVEFIRNTPFLVQLFFIFFGLPLVGIRMSANQAAVVTMVINCSAYLTEILRAGVDSIPRGQIEAATSLGLTKLQTFRKIVFTPALRIVYPALTSQFILLLLGSSLAASISATELTAAANLMQMTNYRSFEVYFVTAGIYLVMSIALRAAFTGIYFLLFERKGRW